MTEEHVDEGVDRGGEGRLADGGGVVSGAGEAGVAGQLGMEQAAYTEIVDDAGALEAGAHGGQGPDVALTDGDVGTEVSRDDAQSAEAAAEGVGVPSAVAHVGGEVGDQAGGRLGEGGWPGGVQARPVPGRGREELQLGPVEEVLGQSAFGLGPGADAAAFEGEAALRRRRGGQQASDGQPWGVRAGEPQLIAVLHRDLGSIDLGFGQDDPAHAAHAAAEQQHPVTALALRLAPAALADLKAPAGARHTQDPSVVRPGQTVRALPPQLRVPLPALADGARVSRRDHPPRRRRREESGPPQGLPEDRAVVEEVLQCLGSDLVLIGVPGRQGQAGEPLQPPDPYGPGPYPALVRHLPQLLGDGLEPGDVPVADAGRMGAGELAGRGGEEPQLPGNLGRADPGIVLHQPGTPSP
ncbi:hypothetical protein OG698_00255 [Streptomyces sp. NBC_01003]|uniref:hypothetical protein n=1 Tax=Streptomyces sp. NBC_01003 TaxID=2903714 RepID=UPI0038660296|nr:hypothetical protein OG698_00255 [Streptomyces sp. NBC_01003]